MSRRVFLILVILAFFGPQAQAFWVWTPETNKWVNPKYSVKETPQEQLQYALSLYEAKEYEDASREFQKLIKHYPKAREAADAQFYIGMILQQQNQLFKAFKEYQKVLEKYPFSERAADVVDKQFEIGNATIEGEDSRNKIIKTLSGGGYDVIEIFRAVIRNAPYGKNAPAAQYKIGLYLQEKGMYQESRDEFEKTINDYPDSKWAEAAKYQIALSDSKRSSGAQYNQAVTKAAIDEFKDYVQQHPDAELTRNAKDKIKELREKEAENNFVIAQFYEKQKQYKSAKLYYSNIVEQYQSTSWVPKALEKLRALNEKNE